jgi:hypothetical protein
MWGFFNFHHAGGIRGGIAQLGERYNRTVEVGGSSPPASTLRALVVPYLMVTTNQDRSVGMEPGWLTSSSGVSPYSGDLCHALDDELNQPGLHGG